MTDSIENESAQSAVIVQPSASPTSQPSASPTSQPTASPTTRPTVPASSRPSSQPTASPTSQPTASPSVQPSASPTLQPSASPTVQPTASPSVQPTASPTTQPTVSPIPTTVPIQQYVNSLVSDANMPLVASFVVTLEDGSMETHYLLNKDYEGKIKLRLDECRYSGSGNVLDFLTQLQDKYGYSITNSSGTLSVTRVKKKDLWMAECILTEKKYYFAGKVTDTVYNSSFGLIIAKGDTLEHIDVLAD